MKNCIPTQPLLNIAPNSIRRNAFTEHAKERFASNAPNPCTKVASLPFPSFASLSHQTRPNHTKLCVIHSYLMRE